MDKRQRKLLKDAMEHKIRRSILDLGIKDSESAAQLLNIDRDDAKRHLTVLKRCGLITYRNDNLVSEAVFRANKNIM
jgi:predicted ArsR family transcriptional regulator